MSKCDAPRPPLSEAEIAEWLVFCIEGTIPMAEDEVVSVLERALAELRALRAVATAAREWAADTRAYAKRCANKSAEGWSWRTYCSVSDLRLVDALDAAAQENGDAG